MTGAVSVNIGAVPSDDPLAFAYGFKQGLSGDKLPRKGSEEYQELAVAYVEGHKLGAKVAKGKAPMPDWARKG